MKNCCGIYSSRSFSVWLIYVSSDLVLVKDDKNYNSGNTSVNSEVGEINENGRRLEGSVRTKSVYGLQMQPTVTTRVIMMKQVNALLLKTKERKKLIRAKCGMKFTKKILNLPPINAVQCRKDKVRNRTKLQKEQAMLKRPLRDTRTGRKTLLHAQNVGNLFNRSF